MGRRPCCAKQGLNRGTWSSFEDRALTDYILAHGEGQWRDLPLRAGLKRCGKSCRLRWLNYLRPDIKRGNISPDEDDLIIRLHTLLGNRWSLIAGRLPGRTDNEIKNYWNTNLSKRLQGSSIKSKVKAAKIEPPRAIRTKAVRCTKVIIIPQSEGSSSVPMIETKEDDRNDLELDFLRDFGFDDLDLTSELRANSQDSESMPFPSSVEPATSGMEHLLSYEFSDWSFLLSGEDGH